MIALASPKQAVNQSSHFRLSFDALAVLGLQRSLAAPLRCFERIGRVGFGPFNVTRWAVDRRNRLVPGQSQPRLHLSSVMAGVQNPSPENPNPLSLQAIEKRAT